MSNEPIYFRDRQRGVTKLGLDSMLEFMYHIWWLRLTSHRTFIHLHQVLRGRTQRVFVDL